MQIGQEGGSHLFGKLAGTDGLGTERRCGEILFREDTGVHAQGVAIQRGGQPDGSLTAGFQKVEEMAFGQDALKRGRVIDYGDAFFQGLIVTEGFQRDRSLAGSRKKFGNGENFLMQFHA